MDILTEIKRLAEFKAGQVSSWKEVSGTSLVDYEDLVQAVDSYKTGDLDAEIVILSVLAGAEMPDEVKALLLESFKTTSLTIKSKEEIVSSTFEGANIVYLPTMKVGSENVSKCCKYCSMLTCVEPLDFSAVTDGSDMFYNCRNLKGLAIPDLSSLKKGSYAFYGCANLTDILFTDLSSLTDGSSMFSGCKSLKEFKIHELPALSAGESMFANCVSLKNLQISIPELLNGASMFSKCSSLQSLTLTDTNKIQNGGSMFSDCSSLTSISLEGLDSVMNANSMFSNCKKITSISALYLPKLGSANYMFQGCTSVSSFLFMDGSFVNTTTYQNIFANCNSLKSIAGFCLSNALLDKSAGITDLYYQKAILLSLPSSLTDCELQGTLYRSGFSLTNCPKLSAASLFSWVAALYDWETNEENKTTIDSDHTLYLTSAQLSTLEEYEGDGTKTGAEVIEQAITYGWNLSE